MDAYILDSIVSPYIPVCLSSSVYSTENNVKSHDPLEECATVDANNWISELELR